MRRRDIIAGLGGLVAFSGAGWYALEGDIGGRTQADGPDAASGDGTPGGTSAGIRPVTLETLAASHSSAGRMTVPVPNSVTVIDMFATWCTGCDEQLQRLAAANERVGQEAAFVSVTNQAIGGGLTRKDIRSFWNDHAGRWPVALDDEGALTSRLGVRGLPHTAVIDPAGRLVYDEQGVTTTDSVVDAVEHATGP